MSTLGFLTLLRQKQPATWFAAAVALALLLAPQNPLFAAPPVKAITSSPWEQSIVTVEVSRKQYDYYQPWSRKDVRVQKPGLVLGENQILTTAEDLYNRTLIRLQKGGRGRWWLGEVKWVDYVANLALVTATDESFWHGLKPATLSGTLPTEGGLQIARWRGGNLELRRAEFTQFNVREGQLAAVNHVILELDSDIQNAGWGEPVVANSHVVGVLGAQDGRSCVALPASFIQSIVEAHSKEAYRGLGYFHFYWQPAQNPASLQWLKLTGEPRGVIVIDVPRRPDAQPDVLKPHDIILNIDGFDLDTEGDYEDPEYGHVMLENLATRGKWAGDDIKMQIWRDGKPMDVTYKLPKYAPSNTLVPSGTYDQEPEYTIVGGLVFQPLTDAYLQSWGAEWRRRAPFQLLHYRGELPTPEHRSLLVLSQVLPDAYNIGYQEQKYLVLDKINGERVSTLAELREALAKPQRGYNVLQFVKSDSLRNMVLSAGADEQQATSRVLERYGISEAFHFTPKSDH